MKLIKAYIRHRKSVDVHKALSKAGFCCMTFVECEGTGNYSDKEAEHISDKYPSTNAFRVIKLEIVVSDNHVQQVIDIIKINGRTGYSGDGLILVSTVDEVYKVRTDETGLLAV